MNSVNVKTGKYVGPIHAVYLKETESDVLEQSQTFQSGAPKTIKTLIGRVYLESGYADVTLVDNVDENFAIDYMSNIYAQLRKREWIRDIV